MLVGLNDTTGPFWKTGKADPVMLIVIGIWLSDARNMLKLALIPGGTVSALGNAVI